MIKTILEKGKRNIWPILCAILFSVLAVSPHIVFLYNQGSQFIGVYQTFSDDEIYYQARIAEVVRGNLNIGNAYIQEHQSDPFLQPPIAEWIVAGIVVITHLPVPTITMAGDIVFVFLGFLLLFFLLKKYTEKRSLALLYTSLFYTLFISTFGRPVSPQLMVLFLFVGLFFIHQIYIEKEVSVLRVKKLSTLLGITIGLTLFISPYYWTTLLVFYVCTLAGSWFHQRQISYIKKSFFWFTLSFVPFCLLYGWFVVRASKLLGYVDTTARFGLIHSHWPGSYTNIIFALLSVCLLVFSCRFLSKQNFWLATSFVISIFVLNWQNIITGQALQFSSHYLLVTILLVLFVVAIIHASLLNTTNAGSIKKRNLLVGIFIVLIILLFAQKSELKGLYYSIFNQNISSNLESKSELFHWFNKNTSKDSVVLTLGEDFDFLLPVYTHNKVFYNVYATLFVMSNEETENRWLIQNIFNPNVDAAYLTSHQRDFWMNRFIDPYHFTENRKKILAKVTGHQYEPSIQIDQRLIESILKKSEVLRKEDLKKVFTLYHIDYILLSEQYQYYESAQRSLERLPFVHPMITLPGKKIYKVSP